MDTLELYVRKRGPDQQRHIPGLAVKKRFELAHALHDEIGRRGNESCVARAGASDPVLAAAKLTGVLFASPSARKQNRVNLSNQAQRKRKALAHAFQTVIKRGDVVGDVLHIFDGNAGDFLVFEKQEVGKRRLRALDLRGQQRFLSDPGVNDQAE